ncbi:Iron-sulfur assembly protein IscA, chloroplastic [Capsicum annuum]|nr:Iron-sulfur assembly protein IscA, chloroplastic [Capsicum annuum]
MWSFYATWYVGWEEVCRTAGLRRRGCVFGRRHAAPASGGVAPAISLTDNALKHLNKMRSERNEDLCLRIGVKQGGCSGMSYTMEFENQENARPDDSIIEYNGFVIVCDPKSLLFIFGMQLDYSDALIGGGFSFKNPNATQTCGCGKSFAAEMDYNLMYNWECILFFLHKGLNLYAIPEVAAIYSASEVDKATTSCFFELYEIAPDPRLNKKSDVLFPLSMLPA